MHSIIIIFLMKAFSRNAIKKKMCKKLGLLLLTVWKKSVKHFVQCQVFAQLPPSQHPNEKYPVNTSHSARFV